MTSKKVILTGSFGVGKTSLFNRFIHQQFSEGYLTTIGVRVNKKTLTIDNQEITLMLWDIAGEVSQDKVPVSYFLGTSGIIYVADLSRTLTFDNLINDLKLLKEILPEAIVRIVANKADLVSPKQIAQIAATLPQPWDIVTSAKTGENVESLFENLAKELIEKK
jgi:small GTP-binding protein